MTKVRPSRIAAGIALLLALVPVPSRAEDPPVFLLKWGANGTGPGQFEVPQGMAIDRAGSIFITDGFNNRVQKFTNDGHYVTEVGGFSSVGHGGFNGPIGIAVDPSGNVYVGDINNSLIQVFSNDLTFIRQWSATAGGSLAVDLTGQYLYENYLDLIFTFRISDGSELGFWPFGQYGHHRDPDGFAVGPSGAIYIGAGSGGYIMKLSPAGELLAKWGSQGQGDGQFDVVQCTGTDDAENVYAADGGLHRIQKFNSAGVFLTKWGSYGTGDGQLSSSLIGIVTDQKRDVFVLDEDQERVQEFGVVPTATVPRSWGQLKLLYR